MMDLSNLLPLECAFYHKSQNKSELPNNDDYFTRYVAILDYLRQEIYPYINAGLSGLSAGRSIYTDHGPEHFDEVVKYAGHLLDIESKPEVPQLKAYDLYVLLMAIRLHDAGNIRGREDHEKYVFPILNKMGHLSGVDNFEKRFIADIAQAHGGSTPDGDKDTIGYLEERKRFGNIEINSRELAALTRFADEICESRNRATQVLLDDNLIPKESEVHHKYASSIKSVKVYLDTKSVGLHYSFTNKDALKLWGKHDTEVYLIDEISTRLEKMNLERIYCMRYMRRICSIERIEGVVDVCDSNDYRLLEPLKFRIEDEGYPSTPKKLEVKYPLFSGQALCKKLAQGSINNSQD